MSFSRDEIEEMGFEELASHFEERGIKYDHLETLEEMQALFARNVLDDKSSTFEENRPVGAKNPSNTLNNEVMKDIMANDRKMRDELAAIYDVLVEFLKDNGKGVDRIKSIMMDMHGNYNETLKTYKDELINDECPIVVAGETSAGKSSLLNLILGTDVLAHSLLGTTTTICRLHNSEKKCFKILLENDETEIIQESSDTDNELKDALKPFITNRDEETKPKYKQVDIFWPIPMLQDHVTIVDTPGIGETNLLNNVLHSYLPKAVAFIYVINSANSGGIQDDYLLKILDQQKKEWAMEGRSTLIDYESTIFVCNKWDKVQKEEDKVWDYITDKLTTHLPGFPVTQILKMSATEADRYKKSGLGLTSKFEELLKSVETLVARSMKGKIKKHFVWIEKFLLNLQSKLLSRINHAKNKEEDKAKLKEEVLSRLSKLNMDADVVKDGLLQTAKTECQEMADKLMTYVSRDDVREHIISWDNDDVPDIEAGDLEVTKFRAEQRIMSRIRNVLMNWEKETLIVEKMSERLRKLFITECQLLGKECNGISLLVEGKTQEWPDSLEDSRQQTVGSGVVFTKSEKVVLAVMAPLWVPLVTAASILFLPVGIGMFINESIKERKQRSDFMENKAKYMREWAIKAADVVFTEHNIRSFVFNVYFSGFESKILQLCTDFIPKQIDADRKMINDIVNDMRSTSQILKEFQPLLNKLREILGKLRLYELDHLKLEKISAETLRQWKQIGMGNFSVVYKAKWTNSMNKEIDVALKVLKKKLTGANLLGQLDEVECLRKLQHPNIVELHGICYSTNENNEDKKLTMVLELCDGCLEDIVFRDENLQCRKFRDAAERKKAFMFYLNMAVGVCEGLAEMHNQRYLHRDLKLSNVLVKENTAKLCDLGFAKVEELMTGTFAGTMTHMSPELLKSDRYTFSSDVFSLSILLWELWYGRHVYSEDEYSSCSPWDLIEAIKTGTRPKLTDKYSPVPELQALIRECWSNDPTLRPQASEVATRLGKMKAE